MIQVLIQVAAGSSDKNFYNERTLEYLETRHGPRPYPYPYGFIIGTRAADGDCVDCYLITSERLAYGTIVECEPIGLLLQDENGEIDHKVLAAIPSQVVMLGQELLRELQEFIYAIFAQYPDMRVRVGPILPREAALHHLRNLDLYNPTLMPTAAQHRVHRTSAGLCPHFQGSGPKRRIRRLVALSATSRPCR